MASSGSLAPHVQNLIETGYTVIPREVVGFTLDEIKKVHTAQQKVMDSRFPGWSDPESSTDEVEKGLAGGFLGVQLMKEQLDLEFHPKVKLLYKAFFEGLTGKEYTDEVLVWLERSNVSLAEPLRSKYKQGGALPHMDTNPWSEKLDVNAPYDAERWEPKIRQKGLHEIRPMEKDRPVQAFVALTDCSGGPQGGGMGCSLDSDFYSYLQTTPPHGRNGHWGKLTRIYPSPGGAKLSALPKEAQSKISARHQSALAALTYPSYKAGDVVCWLRETMHAGPTGNDSGVHACRLYLGGLPDNTLNRDAVGRQWAKLVAGKQAHGRACDRKEVAADDLSTLISAENQARAGASFVPPPPPLPPHADVDESVFQFNENSVGLGFKNATAVLALRKELDGLPLKAGDEVFVKLGETEEDVQFAVNCGKLRQQLGMTAPPSCMVWLRPSVELWVELANRGNAKWGKGVAGKLAKALKSSSREGQLPALVSGAYSGQQLAHAENLLAESGVDGPPTVLGMELLKVLLFRKFMGSGDTNGRNIIVGSNGVLSVDETAAGAEQLSKSKSKGLQTAQAINSDLLQHAAKALVHKHAETKKFIVDMLGLKEDSGTEERRELLEAMVWCKEPFDVRTLEILGRGDKEEVLKIAEKLALVGRGVEKKRKRV